MGFTAAPTLTEHLEEHDALLEWFYGHFRFEVGLLVGAAAFLLGAAIALAILFQWVGSGFQALNQVRLAIFGMTILMVGVQLVFSSFLLSMMSIRHRQQSERPDGRQRRMGRDALDPDPDP